MSGADGMILIQTNKCRVCMLREISAVVAKIGDTSVVCITLHPGFASVCLNVPRCKDSIGHVARAPWDMSRGLHGTCCDGSMGHVVRAL